MHVFDIHICTICRRVFKNPYSGKDHLRNMHREEWNISKNRLGLLQKQDIGMFNPSIANKYDNQETNKH